MHRCLVLVYMCIFIYVEYACMCMYACFYLCMCVYVCISTCMCVYVYVYMK